MNNQQTKYPYIVQAGDAPLSLAELEKYKAEASAVGIKKASFNSRIRLAGSLGSISYIVFLLTLIGVLLSKLSESEDFYQYIFLAVVEIILIISLSFFSYTLKEKLKEIDSIDEAALELIDSDPELCGQLAQWVEDCPYVKEYVHKIAALDRLPTMAEFTFIENWVQDDVKNKPVNDLKAALNLKTI